MSLKKIYGLNEAKPLSGNDDSWDKDLNVWGNSFAGDGGANGIPEPVDAHDDTAPAMAGQGTTSNGIPEPGPADLIGGRGPSIRPGTTIPNRNKTIPNPRQNQGGTGGPPKGAGAFSHAPNAPGNDEEPLPDLPLEGVSIRSIYLGKTMGEIRDMHRGPTKIRGLSELYNIDEMPRPEGSYGAPVMGMLKWAQAQGGKEFTTRDLFNAWRKAGGQPNNPDDKKAYLSFQNIYRRFVDDSGRGTPEQPLVATVKGFRGKGGTAIFRWGSVRASQAPAAKAAAKNATPFDDMELGPAGAGDDRPAHMQPEPGMPEPQGGVEEPEAEVEPDQDELEPEPEEPAVDDQAFDWVPASDTPGGAALESLYERDPDKTQKMLDQFTKEAKTVGDCVAIARRLFPATRAGSICAKACGANLGLPDPDGFLTDT